MAGPRVALRNSSETQGQQGSDAVNVQTQSKGLWTGCGPPRRTQWLRSLGHDTPTGSRGAVNFWGYRVGRVDWARRPSSS